MTERWRTVAGFERYEVSSLGRVRNSRTGRLLALMPQHGNGYLKVHLGRAGQNRLVSRLVCEAFHGPPPTPTAHADHVNFDRKDNSARNLRWLPAAINLGRQLKRINGGWVCVADEEPPADHEPLTDDERVALDLAAKAVGW